MKLLTGTVLFFLLSSLYCFAQDLTGTWEGNVGKTYLKMVILKKDSFYIGYTYDKDPGYCMANFLGKYTDSVRQLKGQGEGFIEKTFGHVLLSFKLNYHAMGGGSYLIGTARAKSAVTNVLSFGIQDAIELKRISTGVDTTAYMARWLQANNNGLVTADRNKNADLLQKKSTIPSDSLKLATINRKDEPSPDRDLSAFNKKAFDDSIRTVKVQRKADTLSRIVTRADSIVITISDNEIVDGDTITIFHNNEILISRLFVSARPYRVVIPMTGAMPAHEFVLVANNLGNIPPNTALVTIEAGKERFQLKAAADMKKNAVIVFEHRK